MNKIPMKIFNISLSRSATTTIHEAVKILGFSSEHDIFAKYVTPWRQGKEPLLQDMIANHDALTGGLGWFTDAMAELLDKYPDAHYILVRRDLGKWLDCWDRHKTVATAHSIMSGRSNQSMVKTSNLIDIWQRHAKLIDEANIKNLLELTMDTLGWDKLAPFLGKPIPNQPFPWVNVSASKVKTLSNRVRAFRNIYIEKPPEPKPAKKTKFKHLILTRYNLRLYNKSERLVPSKRAKVLTPEGWMWHRYWLFREFCLTSMMRQTNQDYRWLIAVDPKTPGRQLKHIKAILPDNAEIIIAESVAQISAIVQDMSKDKYVLTTMLDNDDMLRQDAVEQIQSLARRVIRRRKPDNHCIDIPSGYTMDENLTEFYECELVNAKKSSRTSFVSYLSNGPSNVNALRYAPLCKIPPERVSFLRSRLWARVIHMSNISNHLSGASCGIPDGFGIGIKLKLPAGFPGV